MKQSRVKFTYVDLFSGCGGLSLGLERAGGTLLLAVEKSPMAAETFFHNFISRLDDDYQRHLAKSPKGQISDRLLVGEVASLLQNTEELSRLADANVDLVAGGPPCQGFSLAGKRDPDDKRNQLPWQFLTVVESLKPKMVVIENVVGMRHKFSDQDNLTVFEQLVIALKETAPGYEVQAVQVDACHYGAPQHRPRLMIIGVRKDVALKKGFVAKPNLWISDFAENLEQQIPDLAPVPVEKADMVRTVGHALSDLLPEKTGIIWKDSELLAEQRDQSLWGLSKASAGPLSNQNPRSHNPETRLRFGLYQYLADSKVTARILGIPTRNSGTELRETLKKELSNCQYPARNRLGEVLAQNEDELIGLIIRLKTKKHSQRVLELSQPARTVVTIGDDYVHPIEPRVFTVRELARFQGFPNDFVFKAKETTGGQSRKTDVPQYSQVGNAVSPYLALAVGNLVAKVTGKQKDD